MDYFDQSQVFTWFQLFYLWQNTWNQVKTCKFSCLTNQTFNKDKLTKRIALYSFFSLHNTHPGTPQAAALPVSNKTSRKGM